MAIHDDADMETVVSTTIMALHEGALHIGKADRRITDEQVVRVEESLERLRKTFF